MAKADEAPEPAQRVRPGEFLKRKMAYYGLTAGTLAKEIDVHAQTIYNVTTAKRPISAKLAAKLARRFVETVDVWLSDTIELTPIEASSSGSQPRRARDGAGADNVIEMPLFAKPAERSSGILIDREIAALLERPDSGVSITPFDRRHLEPASYDLTMGIIVDAGFHHLSEYEWVSVLRYIYERDSLSPRDRERAGRLLADAGEVSFIPRPGDAKRSIELPRRESVVIIAREMVQFDKFHLADVGGTARNGINGLFVNHGFQVDPGYSGPMFFTAMNIGLRALTLAPGEKLASLAIRRLHRPPEKAYHADIEKLVRAIANRLDDALRGMFSYKELRGGEFKASSPRFEDTFVDSSLEDVQDNAIASIIRDLSQGHEGLSADLVQAVHDVIEATSVDRPETEALIRHFKVASGPADKVLGGFRAQRTKQTLNDTLRRLGLDPLQCLVALLDPE